MKAKALIDFAAKRRSAAEDRWESEGSIILQAHTELTTLAMRYEPVRFRIPGGHYTPDFMHILADRTIAFVEIKASRKQKGYRDARSKLRAAAELYPWFHWFEARLTRDGWEVEKL